MKWEFWTERRYWIIEKLENVVLLDYKENERGIKGDQGVKGNKDHLV